MIERYDSYSINCTCPICGKVSSVLVMYDDYKAWQDGAFAQDAFPYLSPNERELLISGICADCWDKMFPSEE